MCIHGVQIQISELQKYIQEAIQSSSAGTIFTQEDLQWLEEKKLLPSE